MDPFFDELDYDRPTPSNLWKFPPLPPDPLPISFLEEAAAIAAIEDGVTPSNSAPPPSALAPNKDELRRGKWTPEEENYANKLISEFKAGTLPLAEGTTLRTFLSKLLQCDPMRISKKFVGNKCIGKQVFRKREGDAIPPEVAAANRAELAALETAYLNKIASSSSAKRNNANGNGHSTGGNFSNSPWIVSASQSMPPLPPSFGSDEYPPYVPHGMSQDSTSLWNSTTYNDSQFPWAASSSTDDAPPPVFHSTSSLSNSFSSGKRGLSTYQYHDSYDNYDQYAYQAPVSSSTSFSTSSNSNNVDVSNTLRKNASVENFLMLMDSGIIPQLGSDVLSNPIFDNDVPANKRGGGTSDSNEQKRARFE